MTPTDPIWQTPLDRREFLRTLGRRFLFGTLAALGAGLAARSLNQDCLQHAHCRTCPRQPTCPQADS